jgi:hypothetical protein
MGFKKVFNTKPIAIRKIRRLKLRWEDDVIQDIKKSEELEERSNGKRKLVEASEEGQGPRRAVEPMMMVMMMKLVHSTYANLNACGEVKSDLTSKYFLF